MRPLMTATILATLGLTALALPSPVRAGAFEEHTSEDALPETPLERNLTPGRGNLRFDAGIEATTANKLYNADGDRKSAAGTLTRTTLRLGFEYGATSHLSLRLSLPWVFLSYRVENPGRLGRPDYYQAPRDVEAGDRFNKNAMGDAMFGLVWDPLRAEGKLKGSYGLRLSLLVPSGDANSDFDLPFIFNTGQGVLAPEGALLARQMLAGSLALEGEAGARYHVEEDSAFLVSTAQSNGGQAIFGNARTRWGSDFFASLAAELQPADNWLLAAKVHYLFKEKSEFDNKVIFVNGSTGELTQEVTSTEMPDSELQQVTLDPRIEWRWQDRMGLRLHARVPLAGYNTDTLFPNYFNGSTIGLDWMVDL